MKSFAAMVFGQRHMISFLLLFLILGGISKPAEGATFNYTGPAFSSPECAAQFTPPSICISGNVTGSVTIPDSVVASGHANANQITSWSVSAARVTLSSSSGNYLDQDVTGFNFSNGFPKTWAIGAKTSNSAFPQGGGYYIVTSWTGSGGEDQFLAGSANGTNTYSAVGIVYTPPSGTWTPSELAKTLGDCGCNGTPGVRQAGEPITVGTGNVFEQIKDYTTAGQNPLSLTRYYNSLGSTVYSGTSAHTLGVNWRGTYDSFLHISPATGQARSVVAERADGQVISFTFNGSTWITDTDVDATLAQSGSTWTLKDHNDTVFIYAANSFGVGLLNSITARNGYKQTLSFNSNQLTSVTDSYGRTLTLTYHASGLLNTVSTLGGLVLTYGYSSSGKNGTTLDRLASVSYNTSPVTSQTYVYGNSSFPFALTSRIDENVNTANVCTNDTVGPGLSSERFSAVNTPVEKTTFAYNANGSVTVTNPLGEQDTYTFTTLQNVRKVTGISRAAIGTVTAASENMTYDASGYQASATDWNDNKTTYVNNTRGEPTTIVEAAGASVARTTKVTYSATFREPTLIVRPLNTETFDLDAKGNILTDATTDPASGKEREWTYTYNDTGEVLTAKGPRTDVEQTTTMTYDTHGDLSTVSNALGQKTQLTSYNADGRLESMTDPNALVTNMGYDLRGQLISRAVGSGSSFETTRWTRDKAENVTKATFSDASALTYTLDAANRVVGVTNSLDQKIVYTLDASGNRKAVHVYDATSTLNRTHTYTYDALGRMKTSVGALDQTTTYDYDNNGNLVSVTDPLTEITVFRYDALNRRDTVTDPLHNTVTTTYDALDLPIKVVTQRGVSTSYIRDGFGNINRNKEPRIPASPPRTFDSAGNLGYLAGRARAVDDL